MCAVVDYDSIRGHRIVKIAPSLSKQVSGDILIFDMPEKNCLPARIFQIQTQRSSWAVFFH